VICERFIDTLKEKGNISKDVKNIYAGKDILYFSRFLKTTELYTEADVISFVNRLDNPIDKFIVSAVFFGIRTGEIEGITRNDIHKAGNYISIITGDDKRDVFVPRYTINAALDSIDTYIYVDSAGCKNNLIGDGIIKYRYIKKGNANSSYDYMHNKATRIFKPMFGKNFNYAFLRNSGIVSTTLSLYYKSDCKKISQLWNDREFRTKVLTQYGISDFSSFKKQYYYSYLKCKEK
jgi:integrase